VQKFPSLLLTRVTTAKIILRSTIFGTSRGLRSDSTDPEDSAGWDRENCFCRTRFGAIIRRWLRTGGLLRRRNRVLWV